MKKFWLTALTLLLAVAMAFGMVACGDKTDETGGGTSDVKDVAGDYSIDLSALGMPLIVYLRIGEDGKFIFSGATDFATDKNSGTVSKSSTGYLMVYSTINGGAASGETTRFTKESDGSLKFDGTVYYGSTKPTSPMENEDTGKTEYLYAVPYTEGGVGELTQLQNGVYYGTYTSTSTGMGAGTVYEYYLTLREDDKFTSFVSFDMMGSTYYVYDYGTFEAMNSNGRLTSSVYKDAEDETKDLSESVQALSETEIKAEVRVGPMLKDLVEIEMDKVTAPATPVLQFEGTHTQAMGPMSMEFALSLSVCADGSYTFTSTATGEEPSEETGFIGLNTMSGTVYVLPDGVTAGVAGTYDTETDTLTAKFSLGAGSPQEVNLTKTETAAPAATLDTGLYYGVYTTTAMGSSVNYYYYLTLREDGKFTSLVSFAMGGSTYYVCDYGTYMKMGDGMAVMTSSVYKDFEDESKALTETISVADGAYTAEVRMSSMAKECVSVDMDKSAALTAPAFQFEGTATLSMGTMGSASFDLTLNIYADGSYKYTSYTSAMGGMTYEEEGYVGMNTMMGTVYVLADGAAEGVSGTYTEEGNFVAEMNLSDDTPQEVTLTPVAAN